MNKFSRMDLTLIQQIFRYKIASNLCVINRSKGQGTIFDSNGRALATVRLDLSPSLSPGLSPITLIQWKGIPARSTVDCTGLPRIHDEMPVIADECSRVTTPFWARCLPVEVRKCSSGSRVRRFRKLIFWCISIFLLVFCEKWNII